MRRSFNILIRVAIVFLLCFSQWGSTLKSINDDSSYLGKAHGGYQALNTALLCTPSLPINDSGVFSNDEKYREEVLNTYFRMRMPIYYKTVFLTFDDGPSNNNTLRILKILNENNIKATFFVVGKNVERYPEIIKKLDISGMCIFPHSYSHDYNIYKSKEKYLKDLEDCTEAIERVVGEKDNYYTRLPGGSSNMVSSKKELLNIKESLKSKYIYYVDWNVSSADAAGNAVPAERIVENVKNQCKYNKFAVVLMHDSAPKVSTVEALPKIIQYLKEQGYVFRTFDDITPKEEKIMRKEGIMNR